MAKTTVLLILRRGQRRSRANVGVDRTDRQAQCSCAFAERCARLAIEILDQEAKRRGESQPSPVALLCLRT